MHLRWGTRDANERDLRAAFGLEALPDHDDGEPAEELCALCARHYGDTGRCDEGKPVASPHRKVRTDPAGS
jgi:hypothetical protein